MKSLLNYVLGAIGDFIDGFIGEIVDFFIGFFTNIVDRLGQFLDIILTIFDYIPSIIKSFDSALRVVLWFVPNVVFHTIYLGIAIVCLLLLYKIFKKIWGK